VNGVNVENVEHSFVIRLLKEAKDFIHLVVKRKLATTTTSMQSMLSEDMDNGDVVATSKRHNLAIQQTAATVVANFNTNTHHIETNHKETNSKGLMCQMMHNGTTTPMSSLKPFKVTLSKKDKKDTFGIVLGCKYYIKDILPNSAASNETNLRKGDLLLKLNDLSHDQFSLFTARKILQKTKESKVHLVIKRNSVGSSLSSVSDDNDDNDNDDENDSDLIIDETPIQVSMSAATTLQQQNPPLPPPPPPPPVPPQPQQKTPSKSPCVNNGNTRLRVPPEVPPRPNGTTPKKELTNVVDGAGGLTDQVDSSSSSLTQQPQSLIKQLFKPIKSSNQSDYAPMGTSNSNSRMSKFYSK
jgi:hypothetical protein